MKIFLLHLAQTCLLLRKWLSTCPIGSSNIGLFSSSRSAQLLLGLWKRKSAGKKFRDLLDKAALKAPIFGDLVYKAIIARYSRTLATTFCGRCPINLTPWESTAGATNNVVYETAVMKIREDVATGQQLQFAMRDHG